MSVVLITGCSSGIGLSTAARFADSGHEVYASARDPEGAQQLQELMSGEGRVAPAGTVRIDVGDVGSVRRGVAEVLERAGRIDVLVNNAGIGGGGPWEEVDLDAAARVMDVNFSGALRMIQAVLPHMRERGSGTIVNVTSIAGRVWLASHGPYAASKAALEAASETLAQEVAGHGIRVAIVEPGVILTPIFTKPTPTRAEPDPGSPYIRFHRRLWAFFEKQLSDPRPPSLVAETIERTVTTDEPRLRWLVGSDAEALERGRRNVSDEDWVRLGSIEDDEEFYDEATRVFGTDLFR